MYTKVTSDYKFKSYGGSDRKKADKFVKEKIQCLEKEDNEGGR